MSPLPPPPPGSAGGGIGADPDVLSQSLEAHRQSQEREARRQQKTDEILRCLAGSDHCFGQDGKEEAVDLWHLRELALSRGGLLSPTLRRRAWPKLLGVDSHVLGGGAAAANNPVGSSRQQQQQQQVRLPSSAVSELRRDVGRTAWDVEGHIRRSRDERDAERENRRNRHNRQQLGGPGPGAGAQVANLGYPTKNGGRGGGGGGFRSGASTPGTITPQLVPEFTRAFPRHSTNGSGIPPVKCVNFEPGTVVGTISPAMSPAVPYFPSSSSSGNNASYSSCSATTASGASGTQSPSVPEYHGSSSPVVAYHTFDAPPTGVNGFHPSHTANAKLQAAVPATKRVRLPPEADSVPRRTKQEQDLLLNILTTVLRAAPPNYDETRSHETRLHYTSGLHDLASLLLINLESPSLTTLTLKRLASHHLCDVMRPTLKELTACVRVSFLPLLATSDPALHDHLLGGGIGSDCPFAASWMVSWFTHDVADVDVASRLIDLFLASHAMMPVYLSVAMLVHPFNRERILGTECTRDSLDMVLAHVPRDMVAAKMGEIPDLCSSGCGGSSYEAPKAELMDLFEEVIDAAITKMREVPPPNLIRKARTYQKRGSLSPYVKVARSAAMMQRPPSWASAPTAPTDWALIQKAKAAREASQRSLLGIIPSSPAQVRGRCWSSSSTPTSSPGEVSRKFFASSTSSPRASSISKFFASSSSTAPTTSTASNHRIALDASGLGATVDAADTSLGSVWKAVVCLIALTAAVSYGLNVNASNADPIVNPVISRTTVQGSAKIIESQEMTRDPTITKANAPSRALAITPTKDETKHSFVRDITSVARLMSPGKIQPENAFVYGTSDEVSDEESNAPTTCTVTLSEDHLVDLDTQGEGESSAATRSAPRSTNDVVDLQTPKAGRLNRLSNVVNGALPAFYY